MTIFIVMKKKSIFKISAAAVLFSYALFAVMEQDKETAVLTVAPAVVLGASVFCQGKKPVNDQLTGLTMSCGHMSRYASYSFELWEKDGKTVFSCHFHDNKEIEKEIKMENVSVSPDYMRRLREIAKKYNFARMKAKNRFYKPFIRDAPSYHTALYWPDKTRIPLNFRPGNGEVEKLFREIADLYVNPSDSDSSEVILPSREQQQPAHTPELPSEPVFNCTHEKDGYSADGDGY